MGLDPEKSTFWIQSDVPQVTELTWILSSQVGVGLMDRATSYKDKISQGLKQHFRTIYKLILIGENDFKKSISFKIDYCNFLNGRMCTGGWWKEG